MTPEVSEAGRADDDLLDLGWLEILLRHEAGEVGQRLADVTGGDDADGREVRRRQSVRGVDRREVGRVVRDGATGRLRGRCGCLVRRRRAELEHRVRQRHVLQALHRGDDAGQVGRYARVAGVRERVAAVDHQAAQLGVERRAHGRRGAVSAHDEAIGCDADAGEAGLAQVVGNGLGLRLRGRETIEELLVRHGARGAAGHQRGG
jgi:hypothetical protein